MAKVKLSTKDEEVQRKIVLRANHSMALFRKGLARNRLSKNKKGRF